MITLVVNDEDFAFVGEYFDPADHTNGKIIGCWCTGTLEDNMITSDFFVPTRYYYSFEYCTNIAYIYDLPND